MTGLTTEIRRATRADIPAMAEIVVSWEKETDWMPEGTRPEMIVEMIDGAFEAREIYVIGDPVQAYMSIDPIENKIGAIYSGARGSGIGKALIDKAKEGRDFLWLQTHKPNLAAHRFYEREGFEVAGELLPDAEGEPAQYRMEWRA